MQLLAIIAACESGADTNEARGSDDHQHSYLSIPDLNTHHFASKPWTSVAILDGPERFHFLVVSDRTGEVREGVFEEAAEKIDLLQPAFVMSVGDLITGYDLEAWKRGEGRRMDEALLNNQWNEFDAIVQGIDAPFFYTPGNHDYDFGRSDLDSTPLVNVWGERLGRSYYHFVYKGTLFLVINSELFDRTDAPWPFKPVTQPYAKEQAEQLGYVKRVLEENKDARWTFVFLHQPYFRRIWMNPGTEDASQLSREGPWPTYDYAPPEWIRVEEMLADRDYTIFAGHKHSYQFDGSREGPYTHDKIALATTGGGNPTGKDTELRGVEYGELDHMVWVTMTTDGPSIANLVLDGILPKNFPMPKQRPPWVE